jgi:tetratricopeptide (TPR) repeat protein
LTGLARNAMIFPSMRKPLLLLCFLAAMSGDLRAAEQPPIEVASPHFTLITEAGEKQARHILDNFERMRWMFQTLFPKANVDPAAPIVVIAVKNRKGFQALEPADYLAKGQLDLAGYFLATDKKNYVLLRLDADSEHPYATVYHEYTHLQFRNADWMPLWLNEGIAEFFQNTDFKDKQVMLGEPSGDDILYLRQNSLIALPTLFAVDHNSPYYHEENKGSVFYAESWAMTHFLQITDRQNNTNRVGDYMTRMSKGEDSVIAAREAFGDLKALQNQLVAYIHQERYNQFLLNSAAAAIDPATYRVRLLSPPEYDAYRADLLAYVGRPADARALLKTVMAADPKLPGPLETMGYLAFQDNDRESARKFYQQAIQLNSKDYLVYFDFAALAMEGQSGSPDPQVESSLRTAIQLNPAFAPSYDRLASLYASNREKLDEAQALELKAVEFDRSNFYFRLNASNLFVMRDKLDQAEQVLQAAKKLAGSPAQTAIAQGRIEQIAATRKARAAAASAPPAQVIASTLVHLDAVPVAAPPKHPVEAAKGPRHTVLGAIHNVKCDFPSYLELEIQVAGKPKPVAVYSSDYFHLDLSALGFEPKAEMNPCHDLDGMKARVMYAESSDKTIDGQIVAIELRK